MSPAETTKTEGWGTACMRRVRAGVIQPGEEKVSKHPFAIFRGLMGDYREGGARIFSEGHEKMMRCNRCTAARGNSS